MKRCKTCLYWVAEEDEWDTVCKPIDPDTYEEMKMPFEVKYCRSPKLVFYERPLKPDHATVIDGSEYYADLATGPEYGCVNHEKKG